MKEYRYIIWGEPLGSLKHNNERGIWNEYKEKRLHYSLQLQQQHDEQKLLKLPLKLFITYFFQLPERSKHARYSLPGAVHINPPSLTSLTEFITGICTGIIIKNDNIIADIHCSKRFDEEARTELVLQEITHESIQLP